MRPSGTLHPAYSPIHTGIRPDSTHGWSVAGILALSVTKAADAFTTFFGLTFVASLQERNPAIAAVIGEIGLLPALIGCSLLIIVAITVFTETVAGWLSRRGDASRSHVRIVYALGYGLPSAIHVLVATHNVALLGVW